MTRKATATIGLAMIVKDDVADELRACLKTIAPFVDQIVLVDTGPKRNSASVVGPEFRVEVHEFDWCDDFAKARQFSFSFLRTTFALWADHDDEIVGAENLRSIVANLHDDIGHIWFPYDYSFDEYGNVATTHLRERLVRLDVGWKWSGRLHEVLIPSRPTKWETNDQVRWEHRAQRINQTARNLPVLLKWNEEEPDNLRIWLFVGNQYYADGQNEKAAAWYTKFWQDTRGQPIDRYQAMMFGAEAHRNLKNVREAIRANMAGVTEFPEKADHYLGMCENMIMLGAWKKAIVWGEQVLKKEPADPISFVNPLDYTWRVWKDLNACYAAVGEYEKAIEACELALKRRPNDKDILHNLVLSKKAWAQQKMVQGFIELHPNGTATRALRTVPVEIRRDKDVRDIWVPSLLRRAYRGSQPRIVFF